MLSLVSVSRGSVATRVRCGGIVNDYFIARLLLSPLVKEFRKSVNIWQSKVSCFFQTQRGLRSVLPRWKTAGI